jgi:hypothetical protein
MLMMGESWRMGVKKKGERVGGEEGRKEEGGMEEWLKEVEEWKDEEGETKGLNGAEEQEEQEEEEEEEERMMNKSLQKCWESLGSASWNCPVQILISLILSF